MYLFVFFWVIPRRLIYICRRFGTLYLFHLQRQVWSDRLLFSEAILAFITSSTVLSMLIMDTLSRCRIYKLYFFLRMDKTSQTYIHVLWARDSLILIAARYGLDEKRIEYRWRRHFPPLSRPFLELNDHPVFLLGVKHWLPALFLESRLKKI